MDAAVITSFISSVQNVFATMLQLPVVVREPSLTRANFPRADLGASVGLEGDVRGDIRLLLPAPTAERIGSLFCGEQLSPGSPLLHDALGEMVNMIAGGAKASLGRKQRISVSCPSVRRVEEDRVLDHPIVIPCVCDCGEFWIEVSVGTCTDGAAAA